MLFTGSYDHSIDAKGRVAVPAEIRSQWDPREHGSAWYALPWPGRIIRLYTETDFQELAASRKKSLTPNQEEAELQAILFGSTRRIEPDAAGRIRIPDGMLKLTQMPGEVTLIGAGDRLEIRERASWKAEEQQRLNKAAELVNRSSSGPE